MVTWITYFCFIVVCCTLPRLCESLTRQALYKRSTIYDNMSCQGSNIILSENLPNAQSCLSYCTGKECLTVFYNPGTYECFGCKTYYENTDGLSQVIGNLAYLFDFDCPSGYGKYKTPCYHVTQQPTAWTDGKNLCSSVTNGNLVVIDTDEENIFLVSWLESLHLQDIYSYLHIGVYYDGENWVTVHGSLTYENWDFNQPNSLSEEDCVAILLDHGRWHDIHCNSVMISVCEIEMLT